MSGFIAIDVETADSWPGSICQIGLAEMQGGKLVRQSWLVDPARPFDAINMKIHGLNAARVAGSPRFNDLHGLLYASLNGRTVVSYTDFDARALGAACNHAGLPFPEVVWLDACQAARDAWPEMPNHKLRTIGGSFGIQFQSAHDAEQDAVAAAYVFLRALREMEISLDQAAPRYAIRSLAAPPPAPPERPQKVVGAWAAALIERSAIPNSLVGHSVVMTGDLPFDRDDMAKLIVALGGEAKKSVTGKTTLVVSGWDPPEAGGQKLKSAADRIMDGQQIAYCTGNEFLALVRRLSATAPR